MIDDATEVDLIEIEQGGVKQYFCYLFTKQYYPLYFCQATVRPHVQDSPRMSALDVKMARTLKSQVSVTQNAPVNSPFTMLINRDWEDNTVSCRRHIKINFCFSSYSLWSES